MKNSKIKKKEKSVGRPSDKLPFSYVDPKNEYMYWVCNYAQDGKIISYYKYDKAETKEDSFYGGFLDTVDQAKLQRDQLIKMGWVPFSLPTIKNNIDLSNLENSKT